MYWTVSMGFAVEVLTVLALVALVPSSIGALITVRDRQAARERMTVRVFATASYVLSTVVLLAFAIFLITNHVRIVDVLLL